MLSRLDWTPPPRPSVPPSTSGETLLASVTFIAGLCLILAGVLASHL